MSSDARPDVSFFEASAASAAVEAADVAAAVAFPTASDSRS